MVQDEAPPGRKLVLVVEDEPPLSRDDISIVFADVRMPGSMDGIRLAAAVRNWWPPIKLVVVSGHLTADADLPHGARFFRKPYASDQIVSAPHRLVA
jgi:DNA-binding LytR/AlgR family response regulator